MASLIDKLKDTRPAVEQYTQPLQQTESLQSRAVNPNLQEAATRQINTARQGLPPTSRLNPNVRPELSGWEAETAAPQAKMSLGKAPSYMGKALNTLGSLYGAAQQFSQPSGVEEYARTRASLGDVNAQNVVQNGGVNPIMEGIKQPIRNATNAIDNRVSSAANSLTQNLENFGRENFPNVVNATTQVLENNNTNPAQKPTLGNTQNVGVAPEENAKYKSSLEYVDHVRNMLNDPSIMQGMFNAQPLGNNQTRLTESQQSRDFIKNLTKDFTPEQQAYLKRLEEGDVLSRNIETAKGNFRTKLGAALEQKPFNDYLDRSRKTQELGLEYYKKGLDAQRDATVLNPVQDVKNIDGVPWLVENTPSFTPQGAFHQPTMEYSGGPGGSLEERRFAYQQQRDLVQDQLAQQQANQDVFERNDEGEVYPIKGELVKKDYKKNQAIQNMINSLEEEDYKEYQKKLEKNPRQADRIHRDLMLKYFPELAEGIWR